MLRGPGRRQITRLFFRPLSVNEAQFETAIYRSVTLTECDASVSQVPAHQWLAC